MKNDLPLDHWQHNARLIAQQTGSRVYAPLDVEWQPARRWPAYVRVALILGGSIVGWAAVIGFVVLVQGLVH